MPTYLYEVTEGATAGERFEVVQRMSEPALKVHPESGDPVQRLISPPAIAGQYTERTAEKNVADDSKLEKLGFTKYVKTGDGTYDKTLGSGPDTLKR